MKHFSWRDEARPIIAKVIRENPDLAERELRKKISAEYPFGERANHPYKVWLNEVRRQVDAHFDRLRRTQQPAQAADIREGMFAYADMPHP